MFSMLGSQIMNIITFVLFLIDVVLYWEDAIDLISLNWWYFVPERMQSNRFAIKFDVVFMIIRKVNPEHIEAIFHLIVKIDIRIVCDRNSHYRYHIDRKHIRSNVYTFNSMMIVSENTQNIRNRRRAKCCLP